MLNLKTGKQFDGKSAREQLTRRDFGRGLAAIIGAGVAPSIALGLAGSANASVARGMMRNKGAQLSCVFGEDKPYDEELEYIESSGMQYIDTGVVMKFPCSIDTMIFYNNGILDRMAFGAKSDNHLATIWSGVYETYTRFGNRNIYNVISSGVWSDIHSETGVIVVDGRTFYYGGTFDNNSSVRSLFLFFANGLDLNINSASIKMKYANLVSNSVYVRKLIPVLKDGIPCMYDYVSKGFFYNQVAGHQFGYRNFDGTKSANPY